MRKYVREIEIQIRKREVGESGCWCVDKDKDERDRV
jgi:hypothetical protein